MCTPVLGPEKWKLNGDDPYVLKKHNALSVDKKPYNVFRNILILETAKLIK